MTNRRKALWAVAAIITLLVLAAISIPNLSRSRNVADMASFTSLSAEHQGVEQQDKLASFAQLAPPQPAPRPR